MRAPNVVGLSRNDATPDSRTRVQLIVREATSLDPANAGRVIAQSPSPDFKATKGSTVTISVGKLGTLDEQQHHRHHVVVPVRARAPAPHRPLVRPPQPARLPGRDPGPSAALVSEVMLQQIVGRVAGVWPEFMARFPTPEAMAAAAPGRGHRRLGTPAPPAGPAGCGRRPVLIAAAG